MKNLSMIACISKDLGLGKDNGLLWNLPEDMAFFKKTTTGHPVVMGGNTYASIGHALPGRENIVLSREEIKVDGVKWFFDKDEMDKYLQTIDNEIFVIGGASIYQLYIDEAEKLYLTEVDGVKPADVRFPEFDKDKYEREVLGEGEQDSVEYQMVLYTRRQND